MRSLSGPIAAPAGASSARRRRSRLRRSTPASGRGVESAAGVRPASAATQLVPLHLEQVRPGQLAVLPQRERGDALVRREAAVDGPHRLGDLLAGVRACPCRNHDGVDVHSALAVSGSHDRAVGDRVLPQKLGLDVLGMDVEATRQHDHVLEPAAQAEEAVVVELAQVAGAVPAILGERRARGLFVSPVSGRHVRAAHEDLSVVADADLDARHRPPDAAGTARSARVRGDAGGALRRAVALEHRHAQALPGRRQLGQRAPPLRSRGARGNRRARGARAGTGGGAPGSAGVARAGAPPPTARATRDARPPARCLRAGARAPAARRPSPSPGGGAAS